MNTKPVHLLIVEDEAAHVEAIRRAFDAAGSQADIRAAGTLREYREQIAASPPDLVLMDLNLPDGRAVEVLTHPPENAPFPILVMTAFGSEQTVVEIMKSGALDYVVKSPEAFAVLPETVVRVFREWRLLQKQKQAEASHARLAAAVEQAAEAVVITDTQGTILYANPAFEKSTGYTCAEALGQNSRLLKSGKHDDDFYRQMWDVLKRGEMWHGHFINKRKDGALYEEEATISPVRDAAGKIINFVAVKRNVSHEMELEAQLRQAQKMEAIGTLAGGVAHDFNNILAAMFLQTDLVGTFENLPDEVVDIHRQIRSSAESAAKLVRQLLLFSRRQVLQPHNLDLSESITGMAKMLRRILGENIKTHLKLSAQPMFIHADAGMMDQVLMNLAVNARDAMPDGGQLVIETCRVDFDEFAASQSPQARPGSFVCLSVSDTGSGIPAEILSKIFDPFFTTKDVGKGTGQGLAMIYGCIVKRHGGAVSFETETGRGTTFIIRLPLKSTAGPNAEPTSPLEISTA